MFGFYIFIFFFTPMFWMFSVIEIKKTTFFTKFVIINLLLFFGYCFFLLKPYFFGNDLQEFRIEMLPIAFLIHSILVTLISLIISKK